MGKYFLSLQWTTSKIILSSCRYGGLTFGEERKIVPEQFEKLRVNDVKRLFARHTAKVGGMIDFSTLNCRNG